MAMFHQTGRQSAAVHQQQQQQRYIPGLSPTSFPQQSGSYVMKGGASANSTSTGTADYSNLEGGYSHDSRTGYIHSTGSNFVSVPSNPPSQQQLHSPGEQVQKGGPRNSAGGGHPQQSKYDIPTASRDQYVYSSAYNQGGATNPERCHCPPARQTTYLKQQVHPSQQVLPHSQNLGASAVSSQQLPPAQGSYLPATQRYEGYKGRAADISSEIASAMSQLPHDDGWKHVTAAPPSGLISESQRQRVVAAKGISPPKQPEYSSVPTPQVGAFNLVSNPSENINIVDTAPAQPPSVTSHGCSASTVGGPVPVSLWTMNASQLPSSIRQHSMGFASAGDVKRAYSVAGEFIWHYFHLMQTQPQMLHCFYCRDSQLAHGSSVWSHQNWHRATGEGEIGMLFEKILCSKDGLPRSFAGPDASIILQSNVKTLEAQPTRDDGIVLQATGNIETRDMGERPFAHTVVMKRTQDTGSYVVLHDIFVFLDDVLMSPRDQTASTVGNTRVESNPKLVESGTTVETISPHFEKISTDIPVQDEVVHLPSAAHAESQTAIPLLENPSPVTTIRVSEEEEDVIDAIKKPEGALVKPGIKAPVELEPTPCADVSTSTVHRAENPETIEVPDEATEKKCWGIRQAASARGALAKMDAKSAVNPEVISPALGGQQEFAEFSKSQESTQDGFIEAKSYPEMSYAGRLLKGMRAVPKRVGMVVKRGSSDNLPTEGSGKAPLQATAVPDERQTVPNRTVWVSQMEGMTNAQIESAVAARLRGCPVEGRVVRIERMRNGPAGVIELDSPECVPMLLEKGLCINGRDVRVDLYKQSPSQIDREPNSSWHGKKDSHPDNEDSRKGKPSGEGGRRINSGKSRNDRPNNSRRNMNSSSGNNGNGGNRSEGKPTATTNADNSRARANNGEANSAGNATGNAAGNAPASSKGEWVQAGRRRPQNPK